jgi:3-methyladenine DNA glycosylase AlkC
MEQMAIDMPRLWTALYPNLGHLANELGSPRLVTRMRTAGRLLWECYGSQLFDLANTWQSDTARGWAAMAVDALPSLDLSDRLNIARRFADDQHFAVREWAWLGVRNHVVEEPFHAVSLLTTWTKHPSERVRRFAVETTRPIGVWSRHIPEFKTDPAIALELLQGLACDPSPYVIASLGNWLNDASKSRPEWVEATCQAWTEAHGAAVARLCRRATRSIRKGLASVSC